MPQSFRVLVTALVLFPVLPANGRGQQLLEVDGIELRGEAELVMPGGGTCNVLESDTLYEEKKANHGAPMDIWRLEFSVRNGSGRWLHHLIAHYAIESEWPECTNWDKPGAGEFPQMIRWAGATGFIQESGRNVVSPGQTLSETVYIIVLRGDPEPRFSNWSVDFDFGTAPPQGDPNVPAAAQPPAATAEQENLFWQSIINSTNPEDFKAYLAQFPNGVYRPLAQNRLARLRERVNDPQAVDRPGSTPFPAGQVCTGRPEGVSCWMEVTHRPGCYVWNPNPQPGETVTWTAECADGVATGTGSLTWVHDNGMQVATGLLREGRHWHGEVVTRDGDGSRTEGSYVDGKRQGNWIQRNADGDVFEGTYVDGQPHGSWVRRDANGTVYELDFVNGEPQGRWAERPAPDRLTAAPVRGKSQDPDCSRERLIALGVLTSQLPGAVPSTIQFTDSRMVIVSEPGGGASLRQESEYSVSADAITYRIVRAMGTIPGSGTNDVPVRNPGPHTEACSLSGGVLSFGDGSWR